MAVQPLRTSFAMMKYRPDIPSQALAPDEYNSGLNVETDIRAINSVLGEQAILSQIPGNAIYVSAGFRNNLDYSFIVATVEGRWYNVTGSGITNVTPGVGSNPSVALPGYYSDMPITDSWSGDVLFINDSINPPFYLLPTETEFRVYGSAPDNYVWNYNPAWTRLAAGFMRIYATPNVGSILIAGNLTATTTGSTIVRQPTTVRWSQAFGINAGPTTWAPTLTNIANELEIPVAGPIVDGFRSGTNFVICSYWDSVIFSPIGYTSTVAPVLGIQPLNQGRGLLNENCWANCDQQVFGLDARDIWVFDGSTFTGIGNQQVKDWFYAQLNQAYEARTKMINNTQKNQIEIYYCDADSTGWPNKMLAYRYDLQLWQAPRDVTNAGHPVETPVWTGTTYNRASRTVAYVQGGTPNSQILQKDVGYALAGNRPINAEFRRDNITFSPNVPYSSQVMVHRVLPEVSGQGNLSITVGGANSVGSTVLFQPTMVNAIDTIDPWQQIDQNQCRTVTLIANNSSTTDQFHLTGINWQMTVVSDSR